jgi:hypothetical protein
MRIAILSYTDVAGYYPAIRYSGLTRDGVAVILSSGEAIDYASCPRGSKKPKEFLRYLCHLLYPSVDAPDAAFVL